MLILLTSFYANRKAGPVSFHREWEATLEVLGHYKEGYHSLFHSHGESKVKNLNNFFSQPGKRQVLGAEETNQELKDFFQV